LEDQGVDGRVTLNCILKKQGVNMWNKFIWLWIELSGGLL
jgi:hypothetical protein